MSDTVQWNFQQCWDEYKRLDDKWFKTKKDKHSMRVLKDAMDHLLRGRFRGLAPEDRGQD